MAVIVTRAIKRHFCLALQSPKIYEHCRVCTTVLTKPFKLSVKYNHNSKNFSNSTINKYFALSNKVKAMGALSPLDPSSFSRPDVAIIRHISLTLDVDFENKVLKGVADLSFDVLQSTDEIILDVNDLSIQSIELRDGTQLQYKIDEVVPNFGSKLSITLPKLSSTGQNTVNVAQHNESINEANQNVVDHENLINTITLKFLDGTYKPNMSKYIEGIEKWVCECAVGDDCLCCRCNAGETERTRENFRLVIRIKYKTSPTASALQWLEPNQTSGKKHPYMFSQCQVLGVVRKEEIERSAWEFADTEKYLEAAENLCGPYQWGQYDLLVLPPSFPYGGMENPCLTFVTPTLLAGDRSQADVIVHEIMHSWTGNLVTNRNFEHFWLNEGFTVFLERKVGASLIADTAEAKRSRDFHSLLGLQELSETINDHFGPSNPLTKLVPDLNGVHPDDAFSRVPYEKGSLFLRYLEDLVGGPEVFDEFLRSYLGNFQKRSLDSDEFKEYLLNYFSDNQNLTSVDWDGWFYNSGMPPIIPDYDTSMTKAVTALVAKIAEEGTFSFDDVKSFTPHQMINLLQELIDRDALPIEKLRSLGDAYKVNNSKNSEIIYRWLRLCIRSRDQTKLAEVFNFVNQQGRMKYVRPVYRDLYAWEDVRQQAIDNFLKHEPYMMHVSAYTLRKDLHLSE